jgi:glycosyltransferase involved in cell wall biosynthesis
MREPLNTDDSRPTRRPSLAVCIPSYNHVDFIEQCLTSVVSLLPRPEEIIVRDDASTDGTWERIRSFGSDLVAYRNDQNIGIGANYRQLIDDATSTHIVFLSSDDVLLPSFSKVVRRRSTGSTCFVTGSFAIDSDSYKPTSYSGLSYLWRRTTSKERMMAYFAQGCGYSFPGTAWERNWLKAIPALPVNAELATDWYWALYAAAYGRVKFDSRPLHLYRYHTTNTSHSNPDAWRLSARNMLTFVLENRLMPSWAEPMILPTLTRLSDSPATSDARPTLSWLKRCIKQLAAHALYHAYR